MSNEVKITILPNGPAMIEGTVKIIHGGKEEIREGKTTLCRCGHSANKPFCDGAHKAKGFTG
jgi:CDGSH-type Zn-finger protein